MKIAVLADSTTKAEFLQRNFEDAVDIVFTDSVSSLIMVEADACFDLMFEYDAERISRLKRISPRPVVINSVLFTCRDIGGQFIRINGWPTFLGREIAEISASDDQRTTAADLFSALGWNYQLVPDVPGMITPRIVSMIINEAIHTYDEGVSSREEIDLAMKLGTNYPFGPFEWLEKIGKDRVIDLLHELNRSSNRYSLAPSLQKTLAR